MNNQQRKAARGAKYNTRGTTPLGARKVLKRGVTRARRRLDVLTVRAEVIEFYQERAAEQAEIDVDMRAFAEEMAANLDYLDLDDDERDGCGCSACFPDVDIDEDDFDYEGTFYPAWDYL